MLSPGGTGGEAGSRKRDGGSGGEAGSRNATVARVGVLALTQLHSASPALDLDPCRQSPWRRVQLIGDLHKRHEPEFHEFRLGGCGSRAPAAGPNNEDIVGIGPTFAHLALVDTAPGPLAVVSKA